MLLPDGSYCLNPRAASAKLRRSQFEFIALAANGGTHPTKSRRTKSRYPQVKLAKRPF